MKLADWIKVLLVIVLVWSFVWAQESGYFRSIFVATELQINSGAALDVNGDATYAGDLTIESGGEIVGSSTLLVGTGTFGTTEQEDTVVVTGILATDDFVLSLEAAASDPQDVLSWNVVADTLFVHRPASGASGLTYTYLRIK